MKTNKTTVTKRVTVKTITTNKAVKCPMGGTYRKGTVLWREKEVNKTTGFRIRKDGFVVNMGHGLDFLVPMDALTLTRTTYNEVTTVTKKNKKTEKLTEKDFGW